MRMSAAILAALFGCLAAAAQAADPVTIRLGWSVMPGELAPVIFTRRDLAHHLDQSYHFEAVHIAASPQMVQGLAAGEIDIAAFAFSSFPIAVINAGMTDLRVIAGEVQDGVPGYYTDEFKVRNDSGIERVEDLKGRILGSTGFGAASDIALRAMLVRHKLDPTHDATIIEVAYPNMTAMLAGRKTDLAVAIPPYSFDPALLSISRTLFTGKEAMGQTQKTFWAARQGFIAKNRAALVDFVEDFMRAQRWFVDPANRTEALAIVSAFTKRPPEYYGYIYGSSDYYHDPHGLPDLAALQHSIDLQLDLGFLKAPLDVKSHADLSIVEDAAARQP
jgi:sulfonate transport system substrate-binding protein